MYIELKESIMVDEGISVMADKGNSVYVSEDCSCGSQTTFIMKMATVKAEAATTRGRARAHTALNLLSH